MTLVEINKATYRHRLNRVITGFVITFTFLAILFGSGLIALFAESSMNNLVGKPAGIEQIAQPLTETSTENSSEPKIKPANNFKYNLLGVILALLACAAILQKIKTTEYFREIYYVWQLKQLHNAIYRRLHHIKKALEQDDINAMIILNYYYTSLEQVYLLDDNTLTLEKVHREQKQLNDTIANKSLNISVEQFNQAMIKSCG